jgi:5-methylcytosine-specific restriction endonuclease McrA
MHPSPDVFGTDLRGLPEAPVVIAARAPKRASKQKKEPKPTKVSILRAWHLPERYGTANLRFKHPIEKGIYWYWFSRFIRERDMNRYGTCISCGRPLTPQNCQAGHFIPAHTCGRDLLFDPMNVHGECAGCNGMDEFHLVKYARNLTKRYGPHIVLDLERRYDQYREERKAGIRHKDWTREEYEQKTRQNPLYRAVRGTSQENNDTLAL